MSEFYYSCGERKPMYMGRPRRTPQEYPYSYDPYVIWGQQDEKDPAVYTDRLRQWKPWFHGYLCRKHFGDFVYSGGSVTKDPANRLRFDFEPSQVEAYLCDYMGNSVRLTCIMQHCNLATGYPLWTFHYRPLEAKP